LWSDQAIGGQTHNDEDVEFCKEIKKSVAIIEEVTPHDY